ncbi:hypothetical protein AB0K60_12020 [Thermopolyspora sp. NPDC052614]|uniref:restriction endonuclease subunit S n=1 Tax=Thermopolyspora sp. NPDC052614 TaxID=3155682 RepID=UPI00343A30DC
MRKVRLRHLVQVNPSTPAFDRLPNDAELTFLPMESIWPDDRLNLSQRRIKSSVSIGYTRFQDGDVLVPKITPTFEASRSVWITDGLVNGVGAGTTELHVLRAGPDIDPRFLLYLTHSHHFLKLGEAEMYGVAGQKRVPDSFVRDFPISLANLDEQRRIANFLDTATAQIKSIDDVRSRQLTLLRERTSALITEILLPGSLSSPTGKWPWEWLPAMEVGTPLVRLGYVCRLQSGLTIDGSRSLDDDVVTRPYLRVANVQAGRLDLESVTETTVPRKIAERSTLQPGDVLMTEGGDLDKLGRGTVWRGELPNCLHQNHIFAVRPHPDKLDADYLALMTQTLHGRCYFESTGVKTTNLASTSSAKILSFPIPLPSLEVQRLLVERVHTELTSIDTAKEAIESQRRLLQERRRALITAAVTGQIDVTTARGIA